MKKTIALTVVGGISAPSKMPCSSYSTPVTMCSTGAKMAKIEGSVCSKCYAAKGHYAMYANTIEPVQYARYEAMLYDPTWVEAMTTLLVNEEHFRWFDAGDIPVHPDFPATHALQRIVEVCRCTPNCSHWLPTREYSVVREYIREQRAKGVADPVPDNLVIRLSAMYPDRPVVLPASLRGVRNILVGNVHTVQPAREVHACPAQMSNNKCGTCRACWDPAVSAVSYPLH